MELDADSFCDNEMFVDGFDDFVNSIRDQGGRPASKIQAGRFFLVLVLATDLVDFLYQSINIPVTLLWVVYRLAIGAKCSDTLAKRNVDVEA